MTTKYNTDKSVIIKEDAIDALCSKDIAEQFNKTIEAIKKQKIIVFGSGRPRNDPLEIFFPSETTFNGLDCSHEPMESGTLLTAAQQDQIRLIIEQEWQEAKDHTKNDIERSCFNCSKPLVYKEYINANEKITITQLKEYWECNTIAILCCSCKRVMDMLENYKKNNPRLFELL